MEIDNPDIDVHSASFFTPPINTFQSKIPLELHFIRSVFQSKPNVDHRFDPSDNMANNVPSGYFGVQTSSFSSSSDVNGVKKHKEGASTTVNDNGKVSTYNVEN